ncbi:MAG: pentapeptide repeat-containing protein [Myxococcaceae bacterium]|nr:pentapeptide repeat-containing protein [Myxococcaceae bacterium]
MHAESSTFDGCSFDDASLRGANLQGVLVERGTSWVPSLSADQRGPHAIGDEPRGG